MSQHDAPDAEVQMLSPEAMTHLRQVVEDYHAPDKPGVPTLYRLNLSDFAFRFLPALLDVHDAYSAARADLARVAALVQAAERLLNARKERYAAQASTYDDPAPHPLPASWFDRIDAAWAAEDRAADDIAAALAQQEAT